jgi:hypothetical protein
MSSSSSSRTPSTYHELERLSALETLKGLKRREEVLLVELVEYLEQRGLWPQFSKITLGDLREAFRGEAEEREGGKKRKRRILERDDETEVTGDGRPPDTKAAPADGGMTTDDFARQVMPLIEGNGEVTLDDIEEYSRLDRKVIRHHLGVLVKDGRLEKIGSGRNIVYSSLG